MASSILRRIPNLGSQRLLFQPRRHGYIVLIPEMPGELPEKHALTRADECFPTFSEINGEQYVAALGKLTLDYETGFWKLEDKLKAAEGPLSYGDVVGPLEDLVLPLDAAWGVLKTLSVVESKSISPESYSTVHERARRARSKRFHSPAVYQTMKTWMLDMKHLNEEQERTVRKYVLEGKLNGLDLNKADQKHFYQILSQIGQERAKFRGKVQVATDAFKQIIGDSSLVRDFPHDLLQATAKDKTKFLQGPWTFTMHPPSASQFMQYCPMRELRWNLWQASVRRCGNDGEKSLNNSTHVETIRSLRRDQAKLLGYDTFAHMSMETKMAGSIETVRAMIATLLLNARPAQEEELESLHKFASERGYDDVFQPWDVPYWKRKQQRTFFSMTEAELRPYFPLSRVLDGLFQLAERLFQIEVIHDEYASTWHEDVKLYHIRNAEGRLLGAFYLDPFSRPETKNKSGIGWMLGMRGRNLAAADGGLPLAALVFNFQHPSMAAPNPCCLSYHEMVYLFQKFGQMLQHVLASAQCSEVAGLTNIEWDAVSISSELMAMWLQEPKTLCSLSGHCETGEPLPEAQVVNLAGVHKHLAGHELCKELYLSALDLELHTSEEFWLEVVKRLYSQYYPFELDKRDAHPCSFSAIFSGDWAAAYYSSLWGRMVAADAFSAFLEKPEDMEETGKRFRQTMLETGGACQPAVAFRRFRGRDPSPNALLRSLGLKTFAVQKPTGSNKQ